MCDEENNPGLVQQLSMSRRGFGLAGAAAAAAASGAARAQVNTMKMDMRVPTPDGRADAALFHPTDGGKYPGVLIWTDIMALRPAFEMMGQRLAEQGYTVLVPNVYYRSAPAPVVTGDFNFNDPEDRALVMGMRGQITDEGFERDARAYMAYLDAFHTTDTSKKAGTQGYCMGGPFAFRTAELMPDRIGAVGSFHGGGLTTNADNSPHKGITPNAQYLVAVARNDDARDPESKQTLLDTFAERDTMGVVEVYDGDHGWCVPGSAVYAEAEAERAWSNLLALYKRALV